MSLLENISNYKDLRKLSYEQLATLAAELRDLIIDVVSQSGGHLAPNLGIVELTIALLRVFEPPSDKIIWDVGHQCYPYKILTGRRAEFSTIRQYGGLSGFPKRSESEYDAFGVGHASTSISAALGMAVARDLVGKNNEVVAVIGDGALTGGLAFEGLNNAGAEKRDILIILNDNSMSISPNVGALSTYLTKIIANPLFLRVKSEIWDFTGKLKGLGNQIRWIARNVEESLKNLLVPGLLFEELGFKYYGPIDGHDIEELEEILTDIKGSQFPRILHITTAKGKGYSPAENNKPKFHGIGSFRKETGEKEVAHYAPPQYSSIFGQAMVELAEQDEKVIAISAAMAIGTGLDEFARRFPERFFDVGIAEGHAVVFATAAALEGLKSVVAIYSTFLQRSLDQLIHDTALQEAPVVFALDRGGLVGADGPTHHGCFDLSYLRLIPKMIVAAPKDENELRDLLYTAVNWDKGPFAIRYPRAHSLGEEIHTEFKTIEPGTWEILEHGEKVAIIGTGSMVTNSEQAVKLLKNDGLNPTLINGRFIKPLDLAVLARIQDQYDIIVTVEENALKGGFGSAVREELDIDKVKVLSLGIPDRFIAHGHRKLLLKDIDLHPEGIYKSINKFLERS